MPAAVIYRPDGTFLENKIREAEALPVSVMQISGASVVTRTDGFFRDGAFYHPDILAHDFTRHDMKNRALHFNLGEGSGEIYLPRGMRRRKLPGYSISLLKEHSHNYYHFLFECLPKLFLIENEILMKHPEFHDGEFKTGVNILVDEDTPAQCVDYIERYSLLPHIRIIRVENIEIIKCDRLLYCSPFFNALDNTKNEVFNAGDFYVDKLAVDLVYARLSASAKAAGVPCKRLYLKRNSNQLRGLLNEGELEALLGRYGFEEAFPGELGLEDQVALFSQAEIIVGVSGAAFANMIHMQRDTNAIIFSPDLTLTNYFFFQRQASVAGVNLWHVNTTSDLAEKTLHDDASVDLDGVELILKRLVGEGQH